MPELPEVEGLVRFLRERTDGLAVERVRVLGIAALKTVDPPIESLDGAAILGVERHGKFVDIATPAAHLVFHLAKAGWLRWSEQQPTTPVRPGGPIALRVRLSDGSGFDLTEAGTKRRLAVYAARRPDDVPGIATLGPDPLRPEFTEAWFAAILAGRRQRIKGLLRDQAFIAGIGNAYSDEILHAARMSPYALAADLSTEQVAGLYAAMRATLAEAVAAAEGRPPADLKDAKRAGMRVHGRDGLPCPVCGDTVRSVHFAESSFQYCPTCQTGGKPLADRILSRLLK